MRVPSIVVALLWTIVCQGAEEDYRKVGDKVYRIHAAKNWQYLYGRVLQVVGTGLLVQLDDGPTVALKNYPDKVADGDRVTACAMQIGTIQYTTVLGAVKTVRAFDYGTPAEDPDAKRKAAAQAAQAERDRKAKAERDAKAYAAYTLWLQQQASNGLAWAQYDLGCRYRDGKGVTADRSKAQQWIGKAAAQGHKNAKTALAEMP